MLGIFGKSVMYKNGKKHYGSATFNELNLTNTFSRKKEICKYSTWDGRETRSIIDYIIVNNKLKPLVKVNYRSYSTRIDHYMVILKTEILTRWWCKPNKIISNESLI